MTTKYISLYKTILFTERAMWFRWYAGKKIIKNKDYFKYKYYIKVYDKKFVNSNPMLPCKSDVKCNSNLHFKYLLYLRNWSERGNVA